MANKKHLDQLLTGNWSAWRKEHPDIVPDFRGAGFINAPLSGTDFSNVCFSGASLIEADLSGVNFREADLREANLNGADLSEADLHGAKLVKANLIVANLEGADLSGADLTDANLRWADLSNAKLVAAKLVQASLITSKLIQANLIVANLEGADLSGADLTDANLRGVNLIETNLKRANLEGANLREAILRNTDLRQATLTDSCLDGANLTGAWLWETPRGGWSIKGVICQRVFWDRDGNEPTEYGVGDFERIFSEKPRIVLRYPGGLSPVELAMLPLIIERLQAEHPDCALHIRSVQDDGNGAAVTITVDDLANRDSNTFRNETVEQLQAELKYIEGQRDLLRDQFMPIFRELAIRGGQTIIGQITNPAMIEGSMSRDTYNIHGQAGAVGSHSHAHDMTFQQIQNSPDLSKLAEELGRLRTAMKLETEGTREQDKAIAAVAEAEEAANNGDGSMTLRHLKTAGKWALGIAEKIGVSVAAEAIKRTM